MVAYFSLFEGYRTYLKFLAFICACSAAYPLSIVAAVGAGMLLRMFGSSPFNPLFYLFIGGGVGACIVLVCGLLLFDSMTMSRQALGKAFICAIGGGVLGLLGGEIDQQLGSAVNNRQAGPFILWQGGIALMLGVLLRRRKSTATTSAQQESQQKYPSDL
jgi:hypothetical protein